MGLGMFQTVLFTTVAMLPMTMELAQAQPLMLPVNGAFAAGAGSIGRSGAVMTIDQTTARGVINWKDFSIGQGATVQVNNGAGATLNRVTGGLAMHTGTLSADGGRGGSVTVRGNRVSNQGRVSANGSAGAGGTVAVEFGKAYVAPSRSTLSARGTSRGGAVSIAGTQSDSTLFSSGRHDAVGGDGGLIDVSSHDTLTFAGMGDATAPTAPPARCCSTQRTSSSAPRRRAFPFSRSTTPTPMPVMTSATSPRPCPTATSSRGRRATISPEPMPARSISTTA